MLTYVGEATNDIFDTLSNTGTDYDSAVQSLTQRFDPARNKDMEIYEFRQITQASGETLNEFYRRLKEKASTCEFASEESETRTQIIHKTSDTHLRRKALREEMDLKALLAYGLALEQSDRHSKVLEEDSNLHRQTNFIKGKTGLEHKKGHNPQGRNTRYNVPAKPSTHKCRNCGGSYPHIGGKSSCPAANGKKCFECGKIGHFGKYCLSKQWRQTRQPQPNEHQHPQQRNTRKEVCGLSEHQQSDTDDITYNTPSTKTPEITVTIG